jgi:hypothetical protein
MLLKLGRRQPAPTPGKSKMGPPVSDADGMARTTERRKIIRLRQKKESDLCPRSDPPPPSQDPPRLPGESSQAWRLRSDPPPPSQDPPRLPGESSQAWRLRSDPPPPSQDPPRLPGESFQVGWLRGGWTRTRRTWPENLTISPASGENFQAAARRETGTKTASDQLALTRTN